MSRPDIQDYDYPPGLPMARQRVDHDSHHHYHSASLTGYNNLPERSGSNYASLVSSSNMQSMQSSMPRSLAMHDRDFPGQADTWSASASNANRRTPSMNVPQVEPANHLSSPNLSSSPQPPHSNGTSGIPNIDSGGTTPSARHTSFQPSSHKDRDAFLPRVAQPQANQPVYSYPNPTPAAASTSRSTLWWGELEPWMDEEYAKQVCGLMGWDPVTVKVPHPAPDPVTGQQANNPGYCFLTFPSPSHAASVLTQINNQSSGTPITMPNSTKPFLLNWASSTPITPSLSPPGNASQQTQYPKEYSIFVGDLAPEASNSDLVAVFRNPVLGLRNDREPKFIRPFLSCKSAKIMLDPVTGVSRGYGFVRFTDEADQQRALIEMHGLYCLSRPMRISPATAKYKPPPSVDLPQVQIPPQNTMNNVVEDPYQQALAMTMGAPPKNKSVTSPVAINQLHNGSSASSGVSSSASASSFSAPSLSSGPSTSASGNSLATANSDDMSGIPQNVLSQIAQYASANAKPPAAPQSSSITAPFAVGSQDQVNAARYGISEESWKHQAQARAILSNLIGPNGEQLTSTDPYNTTVFVGGLSPLISEETLRTFFAPFGDIHYVKVPVGKHCGFVQFVRKADAERAIEKMQGFPIGGSRIRLSWGRSQYKAAQAAAQAAQAAALQSQIQAPPSQSQPPLTAEQAIQLLQKFGLANFLGPATNNGSNPEGQISEEGLRNLLLNREDDGGSFDIYSTTSSFTHNGGNMGDTRSRSHMASSFSPFSPDPNMFLEQGRRDSTASKSDMLPHQIKTYGPSFGAGALHPHEISPGPTSPTGQGPNASQRYGPYMEQSMSNQRPSNNGAISRPPSSKRVSPPVRERNEYFDLHEQEQIQDLNGTLASLDLDHGHMQSWRTQERPGASA
ncbi:hypothetical protein OF83DRAFT_1053524 [Amylostereum chailletii]|nr:hypothetical protein OF83DRAFT_1053524 [Amylostereum chailletii]